MNFLLSLAIGGQALSRLAGWEDKLPAYLGWQAASLPSPASCRTSFLCALLPAESGKLPDFLDLDPLGVAVTLLLMAVFWWVEPKTRSQ